MSSKKKKFTFSFTVFTCAVVLVVAIGLYYSVTLDKAVSESTMKNVAELSSHDQDSIQDDIEGVWQDLAYIDKRLVSSNCESIDDVEALLNEEVDNSMFTHLYLVGTDGVVYTDSLTSYNPAEGGLNGHVDFLQFFSNNPSSVVTRIDDSIDPSGVLSESILYGVNTYGQALGGVQIQGIVGITDLSRIQNRLSIGCFYDADGENRGYSAVIEYDGDLVININNNVNSANNSHNIFTRLSNAQKSDLTLEEVKDKIANNETFFFSYTNAEGVAKVAYCMPFPNENINWYFITYIQQSVFDEANRTFMTLSFVMMLCVACVLILAGIIQIAARRHVVSARTEAKAQSAFLSNMSHEIRTPLNGIIGTMYLLEKDIANNASYETIKTHVQKMKSTSDYLLNLINNVLDISKLQAGKVELREEPASVEVLIDAIYSMQKANMQNRCINFKLNKKIEYPWIICDETRVEQILMNIVSNAAKFTPVGGTVELSVDQKLEDNGLIATKFVCADTGCGMSADFLKHIWDNFSQEHLRADGTQKGTGLGMAITKLLVDAMDGDITVDSTPGAGSVFTVVIHCKRTEKPLTQSRVLSGTTSVKGGRYAKKLEANDETSAVPETMKIMLAEDSDFSAEILTEILEDEGHTVVRVSDGEEALETFVRSGEFEFDVILMDMQMPVMDGCTAASSIRRLQRADSKSVIIFACTANTFLEDRVLALKSGMNDFLSKPVDIDALFVKLNNIKYGNDEEDDV